MVNFTIVCILTIDKLEKKIQWLLIISITNYNILLRNIFVRLLFLKANINIS